MTAETATKKRGRPRKVEATSSIVDKTSEISSTSTTKVSAKSRAFSTNETVPESVSTKKTTRKKQTTVTDDNDGAVSLASPAKKTTRSSPSRPKLLKSSILDEATAFTNLKHTTNVQSGQSLPTPHSVSIANEVQTPQMSTMSESSQSPSAQPETSMPSNSSPNGEQVATSTHLKPTTQQSSFLLDFLIKSEPGPELSEDSRISDRSAFSTKASSIDEIVSGAGVSNISTLEALQAARPTRASAIPVTPPKTFKSHSLKTFPDTAEQRPQHAKRQIDPTAYASGSFAAFKATQPLSAKPSMSHQPPSVANGAASTLQQVLASTSQLRTDQPQTLPSQQQTAPLQTSSKPKPTSPQPLSSSSSTPLPSQPLSPTTQPQRPQPIVVHQPPPLRPAGPPKPSAQQPPSFPGKRPTEMSPTELRKNPEFKTLRRRWTGLIVGIPVLVATSYVLWNRLDLGVSEDVDVDKALKRERGVVPRQLDEAAKK
ncbi:hypothetical protein H2198_006055 [Neophaeococcomyces mojaviensis]|uniref:Uncharacterized protein n=1 Tax=Neophaeococcomyces mojaviensis TaxID=3383035 RepID=A0ACC3A3Y4_9EURO|nr:hypothetical protein H2198_006055 [Knufia sp. JES_112]